MKEWIKGSMTGIMREIKILESLMLGTTDYDFKSIKIINKAAKVPSLRSSPIFMGKLMREKYSNFRSALYL